MRPAASDESGAGCPSSLNAFGSGHRHQVQREPALRNDSHDGDDSARDRGHGECSYSGHFLLLFKNVFLDFNIYFNS